MAKKCPKHPRYRGLLAPKVLCRECWEYFLGMSEACVNCGCQQNECEGDDEGESKRGPVLNKWI